MKAYLDLLNEVMARGKDKTDRTGVGTRSIFGYQLRVSLERESGYPLITTKKIHFKSVIHELLWFLRSESNIRYLQENGVRIWNPWADEQGELGPVYGVQWRAWQCPDGRVVDQISEVIDEIKTNPDSRRLIVSAWNVGELPRMALPPCHVLFQFYVADGELSCQMYQRSADIFIGLPFNIASYALLTMMVAQVCDLSPSKLIISIGDAHIYKNHFEQVRQQLSRPPFPLPKLNLNPQVNRLDDFTYEDFSLEGYQAHPHLTANVAI